MATNNKKSNVTLKVIPLGGLDGIGKNMTAFVGVLKLLFF